MQGFGVHTPEETISSRSLRSGRGHWEQVINLVIRINQFIPKNILGKEVIPKSLGP
jgi:hypothetical protein